MPRFRDLSFLVVAGLLPLVLSGCNEEVPVADPRVLDPLVQVAAVVPVSAVERSFTGVVAARVQSGLGFRVPGKVLQRLVDSGQAVKRGQPLMRIDATDLQLATRAFDEAVVAARAVARQTAEDEVRYRDLVGRGAVSASDYDKIRVAAESAQADLNAAQARADMARNEEGYAVLLADADGVVVETLVEPGQVVGAGQVVVRVAHAGQREALIELPETLRPAIGSTGTASLYGQSIIGHATLRQLSDAANPLTRTFEARYVLDGELADAPLGSTVSVQLTVAQDAPAAGEFQVPMGAIHDPGKGPGVWLLENNPPRVTWRAITITALGDESVRVAGDLQAGDRVVALGAHLLHEGEVVRIHGEPSANTTVVSDGDQP